MVSEGDRAPSFTAPMALPEAADGGSGEYTGDDIAEFSLAEARESAPVVLAFFPGVYSRTCTREMCQLRDWWEVLEGVDAGMYGVSADAPFPQLAFIDDYDLNFPLLSGFYNDVIDDYGMRVTEGNLAGVARRSVFVISPDGTVVYRWMTEESLTFPDIDAVREAVESASDES